MDYSIDDLIKAIADRCENTAWFPADSCIVEYLKSVKTLKDENESLKRVVSDLKNSCSYQVYGTMCDTTAKLEEKISKLKDDNEKLAATIKTLKSDRREMANAVSSAVWRELMDRSKNIEGPINTSIVGFGFNDISDVVLNKILDYKSENKQELYKPVKKRRMTRGELAEWCSKGKGLYKNGDTNMTYTYVSFESKSMNEPLGEWILIRAWGETEWREPLVEE